MVGPLLVLRRDAQRRVSLILGLLVLSAIVVHPTVSTAEPDKPDDLAAADAMLEARRSGKQVEVTALASPTTRVMANPRTGGFEADVTAQVSRVRTSAGWRDASAKLVPTGNGSWRTEASPAEIEVGGAGNQLYRFGRDNRSVSLSWSSPLPRPAIDGASATYVDVLPGVDLVVRADITGVGSYLVVKDAEAARNPALRTVRFGLRTAGVQAADAGGGLSFIGSTGERYFQLAEPLMWDSRGRKPPVRSADAADAGPESKVARMPLAVRGDQLEIAPDLAMLNDPDTQFPL